MLKPGDSIAGYEIIEKIGEGGMGVVYLAEQSSLKRKVALKILPPDLARDQTYVLKFEREAMSAARISHQNIVQVYDVGQDNGYYYITMEFIDGESLKDLIQSMRRIGWRGSLDILKQSLTGIDRAHSAGIIHRDIKPDNIMITRDAEIKVADFGLAKAGNEDSQHLTQTGIVVGTPYYMSPEQIEAKEMGPPTDIYSLGITIWHCLTGEPPFKGETPMQTALKHLKETVPPVVSKVSDVPKEYSLIIAKMCERDQAKRFKTAKDVLAAIAAFERRMAEQAKTISSPASPVHGKPNPAAAAAGGAKPSNQGGQGSKANPESDYQTTVQKRNPHKGKPRKRGLPLAPLFFLALFGAVIVWFVLPEETRNNLMNQVKGKSGGASASPDSSVSKFIEKAEQAEAEGDIQGALIYLKTAEKMEPSEYLKGRIKVLETKLKFDNNSSMLNNWINEGQRALDRASWREAIGYYDKALAIEPTSREAIDGKESAQAYIKGCPPGMVRVADQCIDIYEYPNKKGSVSKTNVSWLEALTLCQKQDKTLCDLAIWEAGCKGPSSSQTAFPYGNRYDPQACYVNRPNAKGPAPSGSMSDCRSPYGVYDMSGNVLEWTNTTTQGAGTVGGKKDYYLAGGSWLSDQAAQAACAPAQLFAQVSIKRQDVGFRCCKVAQR